MFQNPVTVGLVLATEFSLLSFSFFFSPLSFFLLLHVNRVKLVTDCLIVMTHWLYLLLLLLLLTKQVEKSVCMHHCMRRDRQTHRQTEKEREKKKSSLLSPYRRFSKPNAISKYMLLHIFCCYCSMLSLPRSLSLSQLRKERLCGLASLSLSSP